MGVAVATVGVVITLGTETRTEKGNGAMENWTMEIWLGAALTLCWALVIVWSLGRIAVFARRTPGKGNHNWDSRSFAPGFWWALRWRED